MGLEQLNTLADKDCPACGRTFNLGDSVVSACGPWDDGQRLIHEQDAVYDKLTSTYVERKSFDTVLKCRRGACC